MKKTVAGDVSAWNDEGRDEVRIGVVTPISPLAVKASARGLAEIEFCPIPVADDSYTKGGVKAVMLARQAVDEIGEYFAGRREHFEVELDWDQTKGFYRRVLEALLAVPYGETITYAELAALAGRPKAARAVGTALHFNPWPIVVPCHRVVKSDGSLGGYGGGVEFKQRLLVLEAETKQGRAVGSWA
jgi:methylated-DNA-[protein]-cysteine S-methyltransferase